MDNSNVPKRAADVTQVEPVTLLLTPVGVVSITEPQLRELVSMGAIREVTPDPKQIVIDFVKEFYPKDPDAAKKYFAADVETKTTTE